MLILYNRNMDQKKIMKNYQTTSVLKVISIILFVLFTINSLIIGFLCFAAISVGDDGALARTIVLISLVPWFFALLASIVFGMIQEDYRRKYPWVDNKKESN